MGVLSCRDIGMCAQQRLPRPDLPFIELHICHGLIMRDGLALPG